MLTNLLKTTTRSQKRIGRGYGSGKGEHTTGRGAKGAKGRGSIPLIFSGTKIKKSLLKRLPLMRGKGKNRSSAAQPVTLNLTNLSVFKAGETVNRASLIKKGVLSSNLNPRIKIKLLANGKLDRALKIDLPASKNVTAKIIKAGGEVIGQ